MKVAIDSGPLTSGHSIRGVGFYTRQLTDVLKKQKSIEIEVLDLANADISRFDLAHYTSFNPYFLTLPFKKTVKTVVTIHDLIPLIYPEHYPAGLRGMIKLFVQKLLVSRTDAVITVSETSKKDIVRFFRVPAEKVYVVYEAPGDIFKPIKDQNILDRTSKKYKLPSRFILYVGDVNYNKNLIGLADACKHVKVPLVIVGKQAKAEDFDREHPENKSLVKFLEKYGNDPQIVRVGFVPDQDLVGIYNLASLYCQPSFYEGFGLPVVQAMACATAVVCAQNQALVEIAKGACLFASPKKPEDIALKIREVLKDSTLRRQLIESGLVLVKNYSWEKAADQTIAVYRKVLDGKNR